MTERDDSRQRRAQFKRAYRTAHAMLSDILYIIGADVDGNFLLRHCDGSVRHWQHQLQGESVVAKSVREFVSHIGE